MVCGEPASRSAESRSLRDQAALTDEMSDHLIERPSTLREVDYLVAQSFSHMHIWSWPLFRVWTTCIYS
jgi:hypothetical protein